MSPRKKVDWAKGKEFEFDGSSEEERIVVERTRRPYVHPNKVTRIKNSTVSGPTHKVKEIV